MMPRKEGVLGVFAYVDDLVKGLRTVKEKRYEISQIFSPIPLDAIQEFVGSGPGVVPLLTLVGGIVGGLSLVSLAVYAHLSFSLITGGKPILPWVPWIVVCFEGTILLSVVFSVVTWILKGRLPQIRPPAGYDPRFSEDHFGVVVSCSPINREVVARLLVEAGAEEVRDVFW